jgi:PPK2 family polyphosphate:nucleotide phosphotransferase
MNIHAYRIEPGTHVRLAHFAPDDTGTYAKRADAEGQLEKNIEEMAQCQDMLYAQNIYALLIIVQAMDAAGKDSAIKKVFSGLNPQGCQVYSFKAPSAEELDHDYLWRAVRALPERGRIGIFNRSYYEEVLIVRVHPEILERQQLPPEAKTKDIWRQRFEQINNFEQYLVQNGMHILKFFLNVSKDEQKKRFLERIDNRHKNWKFMLADVEEREHWHDYMRAYEDALTATSTDYAPWYVIPADNKWYTHLVMSEIITAKLQSLNLRYPIVTEEHREHLAIARKRLTEEK